MLGNIPACKQLYLVDVNIITVPKLKFHGCFEFFFTISVNTLG